MDIKVNIWNCFTNSVENEWSDRLIRKQFIFSLGNTRNVCEPIDTSQ